MQDPERRPQITEVKDALLEYARLHFKSDSPAEAMAMKHMKERALLDQILPPKVKPCCQSVMYIRKYTSLYQILASKTLVLEDIVKCEAHERAIC